MQVLGAIFFVCTNIFMGNMFNSILVFQAERPVFLREQSNKMYGPLPYFLSKVVMDTPVLLVSPMLAALISYFSMGLYLSFGAFFKFYLGTTLNAQAAASMGYFISSMFENE